MRVAYSFLEIAVQNCFLEIGEKHRFLDIGQYRWFLDEWYSFLERDMRVTCSSLKIAVQNMVLRNRRET